MELFARQAESGGGPELCARNRGRNRTTLRHAREVRTDEAPRDFEGEVEVLAHGTELELPAIPKGRDIPRMKITVTFSRPEEEREDGELSECAETEGRILEEGEVPEPSAERRAAMAEAGVPYWPLPRQVNQVTRSSPSRGARGGSLSRSRSRSARSPM